jgi:hypothetical protein
MSEKSTVDPTIDVNDIRNLLGLIDLAAQRGAFKGVELSHVGAIFDRITDKIQLAAASQSTHTPNTKQPFSSEVTPSFLPNIGNSND